MQLYLDIGLNQLVQGFSTIPLSAAILQKAEDLVNLQVYPTQGGINQDEGNSFALEFSMIPATGTPTTLAFLSTFSRQVDGNQNVYYQGQVSLNTSPMLTALGSSLSIACVAEFRYQLPNGERERCQDIPFTIFRPIIQETILDTTAAAFTVPAIGSNITIQLTNGTSWLVPTNQISIGAGAGVYQVISITDAFHFVAQNTGAAGNASSGTNIPSGTTVGNLPPGNISTYPAASAIELIANRDQSPGTVSINSSGKINLPSVIPVDGSTVKLNGSSQLSVPIDNSTIQVSGGVLKAFTSGGVATLTDAETTSGTSLIYNATGILNRLLAGTGVSFDTVTTPGAITIKANLTDAETTSGQTLINSAAGVLLRLVAGSNMSFDTVSVPGAIKINASGITGVSALSDAETTSGQTLISNSSGVLFRLVQGSNITFNTTSTPGAITISVSGVVVSLTDAVTTSGTSLINASTGVLNRIAASTGVTFDTTSTPGVIKISAPTASGLTSIADAETTTGTSLINNGTSGLIKRLTSTNGSIGITDNSTSIDLKIASTGGSGGVAALSDAETTTGISVINSAFGVLKRITSVDNSLVLTDNTSSLDLSAAKVAGGKGFWDPSNGVFFGDELNFNSSGLPSGVYTAQVPGGVNISTISTYGQDTIKKINGSAEMATGVSNSAQQGAAFCWGAMSSAGGNIVHGLGTLTLKTRMFFESTLPGTGISYLFRFGLCQFASANLVTNVPNQGFMFEYSPDNNAGQWRVAVGGSTLTYSNTTLAVASDTAYDLEIDVNSSWSSINFVINGTVQATVTTGIPTTKGIVFWSLQRGTGSTTSFLTCVDSWSIYYPFAR